MIVHELSLLKIDQTNVDVFKILSHSYEAEFSNLTLKMPDENWGIVTKQEFVA